MKAVGCAIMHKIIQMINHFVSARVQHVKIVAWPCKGAGLIGCQSYS